MNIVGNGMGAWHRHNMPSAAEVRRKRPTRLVISAGPGWRLLTVPRSRRADAARRCRSLRSRRLNELVQDDA